MVITEHYRLLALDAGTVTISIFYMEATGYALAHNRIPMIPFMQVSTDPEAEEKSPDFDVTITAKAGADELFTTGPITFPQLSPGRTHEVNLHNLTRVPAQLTESATERRPAELTVRAAIGGEVHEAHADLQVLAVNEWFNSPAYYESIAAFVQPNSDSVLPVLGKVADILEKRTGSSSISGYQEGSQRAVQLAGAIYTALQQSSIRYINPPASFENTGQRIRSSSVVLDTRFGTCVDLSLTFAAVAEQCGLRPVIIMVPGHALTGILLSDEPLPQPVIAEPTVINNYLRSGRVIPIDARFYTDESFAKVLTSSRTEYLDTPMHGLIDVVASHRDGIRPLPTPTAASSGQVPLRRTADEAPLTDRSTAQASGTWSEETPSSAPEQWVVPGAGEQDTSETEHRQLDTADDSPARVQKWKRELLDLSLRNRLLNMRTGPEVLAFGLPDGTLADLDDKIHAGEKINIHPGDDISINRRLQGVSSVSELPREQITDDLVSHNRVYADITENRYGSYFRNLTRLVRTYQEETGSANLYLSLGALIHTSPSGRASAAPLFLIPVKIVGGRGKARYQIQVDSTQEASPNYSLVEWLKQEHGVTIEALSSPRLDGSGLDITYALWAVSDALITAQLPFTVMESAHLLIARFSTYGMWKDLRDHWQTFMEAPVFRHLTSNAGADFPDPAASVPIRDLAVDEAQLALPIPADGTQLKAITAAAAGYSFVLEGPPGTGKSQTITNLIAHAMDQGKTVLFVAEKQAALEVVQRRLAKIGLGPFTLDLHGTEQSPTAVKNQLKNSIDAEVYYDTHAWTAAVANLRSRLAPLAEYPGHIHDTNGVGYSLWSAATAQLDMGSGPEANIPESFVASADSSIDAIRGSVENLAVQARITDFAAVDRWRLVGPELGENIADAWQRLEAARSQLTAAPGIHDLLAMDDAEAVVAELKEAEKIPPAQRLTPAQCQQYRIAAQQLRSLADQIHRLHGELAPAARVLSIAFIESGDLQQLLDAITDTRSGMFGKKKKFAKYEQLLRAAAPNQMQQLDTAGSHKPEVIEPLLLRLPLLRNTAAKLQTDLNHLPGTESLRGKSVYDPVLPKTMWDLGQQLFGRAQQAEANAESLARLGELTVASEHGSPVQLAEDVLDAWRGWTSALGATRDSLSRWCDGRPWVQAWLASAGAWARDLEAHGPDAPRRAARWAAAAQPMRRAGLDAFLGQIESGEIAANDIEVALYRGLAAASVSERSTHYLLGDFHPELKGNELTQLTRAMEKVRHESKQAFPARLLQRRPFTPGNLDGRVAHLRRQLDAKRNAKSFRTLLREYGEEILSVAPCFFVSPASLATYVPPGAVSFDIVVFDEASQVTVDQAMGALGRGTSAVIVGDSKQMPPTRIGKSGPGTDDTADDADDDGDPMAGIDDLESILSEAVESGLPQVWLEWHYRSQDESLIAFSNTHYYEGKLSSLPSPGSVPGAGIRVHRVNGQFIRNAKSTAGPHRTNPVEAEAIVQSIIRRVNDPQTGTESLGVVTFNIQQRNLIMDLLEQSSDPLVRKRLVPGPEGIFVKNLENVQGDERDVILFSTAFSKKEDGGAMPMNFGPLTRAGGERRLNVAVTRARKEVAVYCSFDPSEIDLGRTKSVGMRHLRDYLEAGVAESGSGPAAANAGHGARGAAGTAGGTAAVSAAAPAATSMALAIDDNRIRDDIAGRLRDRGWVVETDYGKSAFTLDLVVRPADDHRWHAAVLTDGEKWAALPTVADRDLTPMLLEKLMGWAATVRVWLPEWLGDPEGVVDRIEAELAQAGERLRKRDAQQALAVEKAQKDLEAERQRVAAELEADDQENDEADQADSAEEQENEGVLWATDDAEIQPSDTPDTPPVREQREVSGASSAGVATVPAGTLPTEVAYLDLPTEPLGTIEELEQWTFSPEKLAELREEVLRNIHDCGPVKLEVLRISIAQRFGRKRTSRTLNRHVDRLIPADHIHEEAGTGLSFVWPSPEGAAQWPHYRRSTARTLADIPLEEIANACRIVTESDASLLVPDPETRERLGRVVLKVFSLSRYTQLAAKRINQAVQQIEAPQISGSEG